VVSYKRVVDLDEGDLLREELIDCRRYENWGFITIIIGLVLIAVNLFIVELFAKVSIKGDGFLRTLFTLEGETKHITFTLSLTELKVWTLGVFGIIFFLFGLVTLSYYTYRRKQTIYRLKRLMNA